MLYRRRLCDKRNSFAPHRSVNLPDIHKIIARRIQLAGERHFQRGDTAKSAQRRITAELLVGGRDS